MSTLFLLLFLLPLSYAAPLHLQKRYYYSYSILGSLLSLAFIAFWLCFCLWYIRYRRRLSRPPLYFDIFTWRKPEPTVVVVNNVNGPAGGVNGMGGYGYGFGYGPAPGQEGFQQQGNGQAFAGPMPYQRGQPFQVDPRMASPAPAYRGP